MFQFITLILLSLVCVAQTATIAITNFCSFPVYTYEFKEGSDPKGYDSIIAPGGTYYPPCPHQVIDGNVNVKLCTQQTLVNFAGINQPFPVTQLEYGYALDNNWYYDLSNVNCGINDARGPCPFFGYGMELYGPPECKAVHCPPGVYDCDVYNHPKDDFATKGCALEEATIYVSLCRYDTVVDGYPPQKPDVEVPNLPPNYIPRPTEALPKPSGIPYTVSAPETYETYEEEQPPMYYESPWRA
ncbi:hypothetical protein M501DRAFT_1015100 [Patellaria atrata CBS 101060]|uniref:Uncharacterized protein n=1 Tax=Patellaria atrata CBS 101060 TaxID=1346257 RepID=A0A9P4VS28_9PEZI|nr:hypothetical protein M501DRAFT_1015100 [Patellaria atrata CBS 101060]